MGKHNEYLLKGEVEFYIVQCGAVVYNVYNVYNVVFVRVLSARQTFGQTDYSVLYQRACDMYNSDSRCMNNVFIEYID